MHALCPQCSADLPIELVGKERRLCATCLDEDVHKDVTLLLSLNSTMVKNCLFYDECGKDSSSEGWVHSSEVCAFHAEGYTNSEAIAMMDDEASPDNREIDEQLANISINDNEAPPPRVTATAVAIALCGDIGFVKGRMTVEARTAFNRSVVHHLYTDPTSLVSSNLRLIIY